MASANPGHIEIEILRNSQLLCWRLIWVWYCVGNL